MLIVADLLTRIGWPLGHQGRTACPIHRGTNPSAFSYDARGFCCFNCGAHGGVLALESALATPVAGVELEEPGSAFHDFRAIPGVYRSGTAPSRRIEAEIARRQDNGAYLGSVLHRLAETLIRDCLGLLEQVGRSTESAEGRTWALDRAAGTLDAAHDLRDAMDRILGEDCRTPPRSIQECLRNAPGSRPGVVYGPP